ncbi:MAG: rhomboid family intramembrane serine protease [Flavobacteriales bacterium]|nr:rhomboid family intramembrane serine protease [Flavobacteriales bacterium]
MKKILFIIIKEFKKKSILHQIIYINFIIFIILNLIKVISFLSEFEIENTINKLYLTTNKDDLISQPWSFFTYIFIHNDIIHLTVNMLWLYFIGKVFLYHLTSKQFLITYFLGGISGGLLYVIAYNYTPALEIFAKNSSVIGASASVLAIIIAIATYKPNYNIFFQFIGNIKLKYIAIICVLLDLINIPEKNTGGHITHLGGAFFGYLYIKQLNIRLFNLSFKNIFKKNFKSKKEYHRSKNDYIFNKEKAEHSKKIDKILEKISNSGYDSLNKEEKNLLFKESNK